jgi:hypothetical protein
MRNKELFGKKLERLSSEIKNVGFHIRRNETDIAYEMIAVLLERVQDLETLLNTEAQD